MFKQMYVRKTHSTEFETRRMNVEEPRKEIRKHRYTLPIQEVTWLEYVPPCLDEIGKCTSPEQASFKEIIRYPTCFRFCLLDRQNNSD